MCNVPDCLYTYLIINKTDRFGSGWSQSNCDKNPISICSLVTPKRIRHVNLFGGQAKKPSKNLGRVLDCNFQTWKVIKRFFIFFLIKFQTLITCFSKIGSPLEHFVWSSCPLNVLDTDVLLSAKYSRHVQCTSKVIKSY